MKNKIFLWEILLYFLVITTLYLFSFILSSLYVFLGMIAVTAGFVISFFVQNNKKISKIVNFGIGTFTLAVCFWMVWSILGSSFVFEDLILIFSEGIFYLIIILSFNYKYKRYSSYLQFLSLAIFLSIPLFIETDNLGYIILALFYLFLWIVITKASLRGQRAKTIFSSGTILTSGAVFFILVAALAAVLAKQGLVPKLDADRGYIETVKFPASADRLRALEEKMYKKGLDAKIKPLEEKQRFLSSLSALLFPEKINAADMEDSLSKINKILAKAKKDADTKEEKKEIDELISIFEEYPEVKRKVENRNSRNSFIKKTIKNRSVPLKDKIKSFIEVNKFSKSKNMEEFRQKARELKKGIPDFKSREAKELQEIFRDVKEWQAYSIYKDIGKRVEKFIETQETAGQEILPFGQQKTMMKESLDQMKEEVDKGISELLDSLDKNLAEDPKKDQLYQKAAQIQDAVDKGIEEVNTKIDQARDKQDLKEVGKDIEAKTNTIKEKINEASSQVNQDVTSESLKGSLGQKLKDIENSLKQGSENLKNMVSSESTDSLFMQKMDAQRAADQLKSQLKDQIDKLEDQITDSQLDWAKKDQLYQKAAQIQDAVDKGIEEVNTKIDQARDKQDLKEVGKDIEAKTNTIKEKINEASSQVNQDVTSESLKGSLGQKLKDIENSLKQGSENLKNMVSSESTDSLFMQKMDAQRAADQLKSQLKDQIDKLEDQITDSQLDWAKKDQLYQKADKLEQVLKETTESVKNDIEKAQSQSGLKKVSRKVNEEGEKLKSAAKQIENEVNKEVVDKELNRQLQGRTKKLGQVLKDGLNKLKETLKGKTQQAEDVSGLADAFEKIKETSEISRLNEIYKKVNEIQKKANKNQQAWKDIQEIAESKAELLFAKASEELSGSEEGSHLSELAKDYLQTIVSSQDYDNVLESAGKLSEIVKSHKNLAEEIHNSQGYKTGKERLETVKQNKKNNIGQQLKEEGSFSQDRLKQLTESLENSGANSQEIKENLQKVEEAVKKMPEQGVLSQNSEEKVLSELEDFSKAAQAKSILENMFKEQEAQKYEDASGQLSKMLEKLDIQDEEKEQKLQEMKARLAQSDSLAEIEMIKKEMQELIKPSENQRHLKRQAEKVKEAIEEISRQREKALRSNKIISLMENLNTVKNNIKEKATEEKIEQIMKKLKENYLNNESISQELKEELEELAENISNNFYNTEEELQKAGLPGWDFIVFPKQVVVAEDNRKQLSSLGIYRGKFLKDITSDVYWKVEDNSVAWINEQGVLYGISKGRTQGYAVYNEDKKTIDIIVAEPLER
jgi:S-adenosylmethionine/arginine decarboxylase-like enzyme